MSTPHPDLLWRCQPDRFAEHLTRHLDPEQRFQRFRHIRLISQRIAEAVARGRGRLLINLPPQHGKSLLLSRWVPIWYLDNLPHRRVIVSSYSRELVRGHSSFVRDEFARNPGLMTQLRADSKAANRWNTREGGGMFATTIGGAISGFSGDLMLLDDPYKGWKDAWSPTVRRDVQNWFDSEFYMRRQEHTTMIVLHTRWHPSDLTSYLLEKHPDDWQMISLPGIAEDGDILGRRPGEALCPELHSERDLLGARTSEAIWQAVVQQNPQAMGDDQCYGRFSDRNIDDALELRDGLPLHMAWDFNVRPGMHCILGQHWLDRDEIIAYDELHGPGWDVRHTMEQFERWWTSHDGSKRFGEVHIFGDVSGRSRTQTTSESCYDLIVAKLRSMGVAYRIRVPSGAPSVRDSVDDFNEALLDIGGKPHYRLRRSCRKLLRDLRELGTDEHGLPDKSDMDMSHASDAERYRVTRLRPISRRPIQAGRVGV